MNAALELRRHTRADLDDVRGLLIDVYAEVYADRLDHPFWTVDRFAERLDGHVSAARWEAVVGWDAGQPVGYIYAAAVSSGSSWWTGLDPPVTDRSFAAETGTRTCAIFELMVRQPWRGTGAARHLHDELVTHRPEERASLAVERDHPRVRAMYERWGYRYVGASRPFPDAPLLDLMVLPLRGDSV